MTAMVNPIPDDRVDQDLGVRLTKAEYDSIKKLSEVWDRSMSRIMRYAVQQMLEEYREILEDK